MYKEDWILARMPRNFILPYELYLIEPSHLLGTSPAQLDWFWYRCLLQDIFDHWSDWTLFGGELETAIVRSTIRITIPAGTPPYEHVDTDEELDIDVGF